MDDKQKQWILSVARTADPSYEDLYYELDMGDGGRGLVQCEGYEWFREKSNANVREKGFSFYLARTVFEDPAFITVEEGYVIAGEKRVKIAGCPFGIEGSPLLVVVEVALDEEIGFHHIISSWENSSVGLGVRYDRHKAYIKRSHQSSKPLSDEERERVIKAINSHAWKTRRPDGSFEIREP